MGTTPEEKLRVLLVDDRMARIEFLENVLFHQGFEVFVVSDAELDAELARATPAAIVSYLPIDADRTAGRGAPVLMLVDDPAEGRATHEVAGSGVTYLPRTVDSDVLAKKIACLVRSRPVDSGAPPEDRDASDPRQHLRVVDGHDEEST